MIDIERIKEVGYISIVKIHMPEDPKVEFFLMDSYHNIHRLTPSECLIKKQTSSGYKDIIIPTKMITDNTLKDVFEAIERFGIFNAEFAILGDITQTENFKEYKQLINARAQSMQLDSLIERNDELIEEYSQKLGNYHEVQKLKNSTVIQCMRELKLI